MIDVTGIDLVKFVQKVYELSAPQGLGFMHFQKGKMSSEGALQVIKETRDANIALSMDYIGGRACKMTVYLKDGKMEIDDVWYDHTNEQYKELLAHIGIKMNIEGKHNRSCNCSQCR